jgi:hypothetical protein
MFAGYTIRHNDDRSPVQLFLELSMRPPIRVAASVLAILALGGARLVRAQGSDSAKKQPQVEHTVGRLGWIRSAHIAFGSGQAPYVGRTGGAQVSEFRLGLSLKALPNVTFALASTGAIDTDTTSYVVAESHGYHPKLAAYTQSLEIQRRWRNLSLVHPLATAAVGSLVTSYNYVEYPRSGGSIVHRDQQTSSTFYALAGGGELNVLSWMRATMTIGYRSAGATTLPNRTASNSGLVVTSLVELGKF